jgi:hypothetical protein
LSCGAAHSDRLMSKRLGKDTKRMLLDVWRGTDDV